MEKVTACLIVKNEETNIGECLKSLSFVDEIIVVDSGSIDKTIEIAKQYTKNVYKKEWLGFANQRNYAASLATSEWILAIDADERISKELSAEIVNILVAPKHDVYDIPMTNFVINRWMKFSGLGNQLHKRLYKKNICRWDVQIHEDIIGYKSKGILKHKMMHYAYNNVTQLINKINSYTTIEALKYNEKKPSIIKEIFFPSMVFLKKYIFQLGFLDGRAGYLWAISLAYYHRLIFMKVRMKYKKI